MRLLPIALSLLMAACAAEDDPKDAPPTGGGGGGGGGGSRSDAMPSRDDGGLQGIAGQLCFVTDLRQPSASCDDLGSEYPLVTVTDRASGAEVDSEPDGSFVLPLAAENENYELQVGFNDADYRNVYVAFRGDSPSLQALVIRADDWESLMTDIDVQEVPGSASIAAYAAVGGVAEAGVRFAPPEGTAALPFYDGSSPTAWAQDTQTGTFGAGLLISVPVVTGEPASFSARQGDGALLTKDVPIFPDTTTFAVVEFPAAD